MADLKEICDLYSFRRLTKWRNLTESMLTTIRNQFGINDDEVIAFYDSSAFENSKVGLAICNEGIYYRNSFQSSNYLNWKQVRSLKLTYDNSGISFGDNHRVFIFSDEVDDVVNMVYNIKVNAKIDNIVQKTTGFLGFLENAAKFLSELDTSTKPEENEALGIGDAGLASVKSNNIIETNAIIQTDSEVMWTIAFKGKAHGPFKATEVKNWISINNNNHDNIYAIKKGMADWKLVNDIPEFKQYMESICELPPIPEF